MKVLITGHSGLLGSTLAERLLTEGHIVYGISRSKRNTIAEVHSHYLDLQESETTNKVISEIKPDVIYHLAANASQSIGQNSPIDMTQRNIGIFTNVLRSAIANKVNKFIYSSSIAVYGNTPSPYNETNYTNPQDVYGINKLACERILKVMSKVHGFQYTIFRPHNLYGERQNMADPTRNVTAMFMRRLLEGKPCTLYDGGKMVRGFSYADDVADIFTQALGDDFNGIVMNVGSTQETTIKDFLNILINLTGMRVEVIDAPARPQEISWFIAGHEIQKRMCNYKDTPLLTGLVKTWYAIKDMPLPPLEIHNNEIENTLR